MVDFPGSVKTDSGVIFGKVESWCAESVQQRLERLR